MKKTSAYYGERGQYPQPGTVVRRGQADPGHSWGRAGEVYDFHANGDPACEHQQDSEWRDASDHCTGHYNPKHPLQAAIDKYNNYKGRKDFVPIMNNTWIHKDDQDNFHIRHHNTDILSVAPNGDTTIDVDGFHTATTGKRLHQFLPKNIAKMRNPSRAQGASDHVVAVNSDPDHYVYGTGEERGRFGMHTNTTLHDYEDGISFNAHTGERIQNNAASHSGTTVRPPNARGVRDSSDPTARPGRGGYSGGDSYDSENYSHIPAGLRGPAHPLYDPAVDQRAYDPRPMHEQQSTHEQIRRQLDEETRHPDAPETGPMYDSYRYNPGNTSGSNSLYDDVHHGIENDDLPREDESYDDWLNRTTKPAANVPCPSCKGRGQVRDTSPVPPGVQPWEHKKDCPSCSGTGLVANTHRLSARTGSLISQSVLRQRYEDGVRIMATLIIESYGETKAPSQVDTLRDDTCPVCGDSDAFDGDQCQVCGYVTPPKMFQDPDLEKARLLDLRADPATGQPNDTNPNVGANLPPVDPAAVDEEGEVPGADVVGADAGTNYDDTARVEDDVRTLDDQPADPDEIDEDGEIGGSGTVDMDAPGQQVLQGGEPFTKGPNAPAPEEPMAPEDVDDDDVEETGPEGEGDEAPVGEENEPEQTGGEDDEEGGPGGDGQEAAEPAAEAEGAPGYPGDNVGDLLCPACGYTGPGATPMSTGSDLSAPAAAPDGLLEGDVCPNCQKATLMGVGQVAQMEQMA